MDESGREVHRNTIEGAVRLSGVTIQARDIHGGVHVYGPPRPVPRQLPPVPAHFTNRLDDLAALDELWARRRDGVAPRTLIVVNGPPGIGKTALASRWLSLRDADFPDGQLYVDLQGYSGQSQVQPAEALGRFLRALGAESLPAELSERASQWRSRSSGLRLAVMLDNALTAAQVRPMLLGGPDAVVVVTSRRRLTGLGMDGAEFHRVEGLGPADAVELLSRGAGRARIDGEPVAARRIVELCAGLPLAVCLASARLAARPRQPVAVLAAALGHDADGLTALDIEGEATVSKALDASYAALGAEAARVYRALGELPLLTFDAATAAVACGESVRWAERRLDELVEANLVEDLGPDTYRFHDLVRAHAQGVPAPPEAETGGHHGTTLRRVCDWYLHAATAAEELLTPAQFTLARDYADLPAVPAPFTDEAGALGWLDAHRAALMALVRTAADRGWHATAWQLVDAMWPLFLRLRHYDLWIEAHERGLAAAREDGNTEAERQMLNSGAIGLTAAGRIAEAARWYASSLLAARAAGDVRDEGQALLGLGSCERDAGRPAEAEPFLRQAMAVWEGCGYLRGVALARTALGEVALATGRTDEAVACFARARDELLAVRDPHDAARALAFLGRARARNGEHAAGTAQMEEALAVFASSGAAHWQARTLEMLGLSAQERGAAEEARDLWARALALYEVTSQSDARRLTDLLADG